MEEEREWAAPDSLKGLLQRGRGEGFLRALSEPATAGPIVIRCVTEDPRWDHQVEDRSLFYARLVRELDLDLGLIEAHLFDPSDSEAKDEHRTGLPLVTLGDLAEYGDAAALGLLRRYAVEGWNWRWAFHALEYGRGLDALAGLEAAMLQRFRDVETLVTEVGSDLVGSQAWRTWAQTEPVIREAIKEFEAMHPRPTRASEEPGATTADLLELVARKPGACIPVERTLRTHTSPQDKDLMMAAIRAGHEGPRATSFRALGSQHDDRILEWADEALSDDQPERVQNCARVGLTRLGTPASIAWARARAQRTDLPGRTAIEILAAHGDMDDVLRLLGAFERARDGNDVYLLCDLADGFARLKDERAVPLLEATFRDAVYSYLRRRCATALGATSRTFPEGLAIECLWDCEAEARRVGATLATEESALVPARLGALAEDPLEDDSVRSAALERTA